jgi:hypothetical protein
MGLVVSPAANWTLGVTVAIVVLALVVDAQAAGRRRLGQLHRDGHESPAITTVAAGRTAASA